MAEWFASSDHFPVQESVASTMILPVLVVFFCAALAESMDEGQPCSLTNNDQGVCALLNNCQSVQQKLIFGNVPDKICGYSGFEPIVCCPSPGAPANLMSDGRGAISRQKCTEYAQSVFVLKYLPTLVTTGPKLVNVSECATTDQTPLPPGSKARPGEFPYMAAVGFDSESVGIDWRCGGTLISENFVLTAAHCTYSASLGNATWVRVGDLNLVRSDDGAMPEERRIVERIRHPDYKLPSQYHDIALLRLETRVPFNRWIRPACLYAAPSVRKPRAIAMGWGGVTLAEDENRNDLLKIILPIVDSKSCEQSWSSGEVDIKLPNGVVDDWMICAESGNKDTCQDESGGPLVILSENEYCMDEILGIKSLGNLCGSQLPGIYTRIYNYIPWIESIVWGQEQSLLKNSHQR